MTTFYKSRIIMNTNILKFIQLLFCLGAEYITESGQANPGGSHLCGLDLWHFAVRDSWKPPAHSDQSRCQAPGHHGRWVAIRWRRLIFRTGRRVRHPESASPTLVPRDPTAPPALLGAISVVFWLLGAAKWSRAVCPFSGRGRASTLPRLCPAIRRAHPRSTWIG